MSKLIRNPTHSVPRPPESNALDVQPLRFRKRRSSTPEPQEECGSSTTRNDDRNVLANSIEPTNQRPPHSKTLSSLINADDPAFSSNPHHHPDHHGLSLGSSPGKGKLSLAMHTREVQTEPPPAYDDAVLASTESLGLPHLQNESTSSLSTSSTEDGRRPSHLHDRAEASYSPLPTPFSSTSTLSQPQPSMQGDMDDQTEDLLAYLQNGDSEPDGVQERNIPMSLRPHKGLPMTSQASAHSQGRSRPARETLGLVRSATAPSVAIRSVSEPPAAINERPHVPRRGNTSSPRRVVDLDRIDELDETTPLGLPLHHRGPYEMQGKVDTPPMRAIPTAQECQLPPPKQHVLVAETPADVPPAPVPFKLNLKPGELLTRVPPPARSRTTPPERDRPLATGYNQPVGPMQPVYRRPRSFAQDQSDTRYPYRDNGRNEWTPEQLYENHQYPSLPMIPRDVRRHPYHVDTRISSPSSSASTPRSDVRPTVAPYLGLRLPPAEPPRQRQVTFQQPPEQSSLSRSISQPVSSASSMYSASSSSLSRGPPSSADRHRPKRIVMPAPLQQQNRNYAQLASGDMYRRIGQNGVVAQSTAAVIPVHDPKKGNFLKKRASTSSPAHQNHKHLAPERVPSTKGFFSLGGGFGRSLTPDPEPSLPKSNRKLSKRSKAA